MVPDNGALDLGEIYSRYANELLLIARRRGFDFEDARDCTQEFFQALVEKGWLKNYDGQKGELHSFLRLLFQRFLINKRQSQRALKRGGLIAARSLESLNEEGWTVKDWRTPDWFAQLHSAQLLVDRAIETLRKDLTKRGKTHLLDALLPHLLEGVNGQPLAVSAEQLGLSDVALRMTISRYRKRLRILIRREVRCEREGSPDEEMKSLKDLLRESR